MGNSGSQPEWGGGVAAQPRRVNNFMRRATQPYRYEADEHHLMPEVKKPAKLDVNLADAESVAVRSKTEEVHYTTTKRPDVSFAGTLVVEDIPDAEPEPEEVLPPNEAAETASKHAATDIDVDAESDENNVRINIISKEKVAQKDTSERLSFVEKLTAPSSSTAHERVTSDVEDGVKLKVTSTEKNVPKKKQKKGTTSPRLQNYQGVIGMQRVSAAPVARHPDQMEVASQSGITSFVLSPAGLIVLFFFIGIGFLSLGIESKVVVLNDTTVTSYRFSVAYLLEQVETVFSAAVAYSQNWVR